MPALHCLHTHILLHMTTGQTSGVALCPHCNARHTTSNTYLIHILLRSIGGNSLCCTRCAIYPLYVLLCITSDLFKLHYCSALGTATRSNGCCNAKLAVPCTAAESGGSAAWCSSIWSHTHKQQFLRTAISPCICMAVSVFMVFMP